MVVLAMVARGAEPAENCPVEIPFWQNGCSFRGIKDSLRKTYFRYSNPHNRLAVDQDSEQVITSEQSQLNEVRDLLDLLNGECEE